MKKIIINQNINDKIFGIFAIAVLFEPAFFSRGSIVFIDIIYDILKMMCALLIGFRFVCRMKINVNIGLVRMFEACLFFSTLLMGADAVSFFKTGIYIITTAMLLEWLLESDAPAIISSVGIIFGIYSYVSLLTFLLFPRGMYIDRITGWSTFWFLGHKNAPTAILLVGMVCVIYDSLMKTGKVSIYAISVIVCSSWYLLGVSSMTGIVTSVLALLLMIMSYRIKVIEKIFSCKNIILGNFLLFFLFVFVRIQDILDIFGNLFLQLGKEITFSSRTYLWDRVIPLIQTSVLWGHGAQTQEKYRNISRFIWGAHLHSYYLQVLFEGGIIAFSLLFGLLFIGGVHFDEYFKKRESLIIKYGLMAYLLASQMEVYDYISSMFILIFMLYHIEKIEEQYEPLHHEYEMSRTGRIQFMWGKKALYKKKQNIVSGENKEFAEE